MTDNKISFNSVHKSITGLAETTLPKLVVLTGRNGSGKTHLLEAINEGNVRSTLAPNFQSDVLLFDWNSIIPKDTGVFHPSQHQTQRSNWFQQIRMQQENSLKQIQQQAISWGIPAEHCTTLTKIKSLDEQKLQSLLSDSQQAPSVYKNLKNLLNQNAQNIYSQTQRNIGDEQWKKAAPKIFQETPDIFLETSESIFFSNRKLLWGEVDAFQQAFGRLFSTYRDLIHLNDRLEKYPPKNDEDLKHLNQEQFVEKHGEPPWDFVNRILEVCNLDFRVEPPPLHEVSSYEPKLNKLSKDVEMRFQDLSSGEKVLMSFALCLYNASDERQEKHFPKLLLLDEVDAPLHPSMVLSLLKTIQDVLVDGKGVSVILTTHSPSTVALAPEETLYEMNPSGPLVEKISRSRALSILTSGVPTLSVSFDGRRQVFVESKTDAFIYEKLYQAYKQRLNTERSLTFIEVGRTDSTGVEKNSGCAQVERIVNALVENGNSSVFGLVDWDGERESSDRIHVLSPRIRDGVETLVLDPVLLAATVIKENHQFCVDKEIINADDRYTHMGNWDQSKWQSIINNIQKIILEREQPADSENISYLSGMSLNVNKEYLHMDDHALEERVISKFGFLQPKNNHAGGLMKHIVTSVLGDYPDLLPRDLITTFSTILDADV
ncbi:ATP-dependent nuclease [Pseudoalteromonas maricaloris]|uniref:AAA family ATPase n=1 Tax=Pseudoalteromonas maricaloris TaxID=184924 RepID=A0A8I2H680_9GAMM|nr:AAA family ATPase [Pseudoalteromonas maricaloris]NLR23748.1 ATP-binding protein [Pseudoalteromonas maricaloris]RZG12478.1 ATP-binding protein [Pseudoalteromonas sp. CO342X]WOX31227.1 AAA family ATPase [Pseudoalteromonas maricaloris]